jgi:transcriptional regulator with XRE-family HTH domain
MRRRISQQTLADHIGITQQSMSYYERGLRQVPTDVLKAISRECGKSLDFFVEHPENYKDVTKSQPNQVMFGLELTDEEVAEMDFFAHFLVARRKKFRVT